jgi:hypothetical protein
MAFPQTPLDVRTELQVGGVWTDESAGVYLRDPITITQGRADEASRPDHCRATITFNNRLGRYSPRNPQSPLYGLIGRNTPVRISVPAAARYLRLTGDPAARASTPDASALDVVGDIDIRVDATLTNWDTGANFVDLVGKWQADGNFSWRLSLDPQGRPYLVWTPDGIAANGTVQHPDTPLPVPSSGRISLRVTLDVDNGAGGNTANFYYSLTPGTAGPWTLLGSFSSAGVTSIFNSTAGLDVGDITGTVSGIPPVGKVHAIEVRAGIGGTVVASPIFSTPAAGAASFTDSAGRTWTMSGGAEISDRDYRVHAEVSSWPPKWDVSGRDRYVPVEAAGPLRRYGVGTNPLQSTLRRRIASWPTTVAYWPMEDGAGATQAYSALPGGQAAQVSGAQMAADDTLAGSQALPTWPQGSRFMCPAPTYTAATSWQVQCVFRVDTSPATQTNLLVIQATGTIRRWELAIATSSMRVRGYDASDNLIVDSPFVVTDAAGPWTRLRFSASTSGGTVTWSMQLLPVGGSAGSGTGTLSGTSGQVTDVHNTFIVGLDNLRLGHVAVFSDSAATAFDQADTGFDGEQAHARINRLCAELGMPVTFPAGTGPTAAMGPQRPAPILDLLGECADADMGVLHESRDVGRLAYRRRRSFYDQAVRLALDYAVAGHVAPPLEPVDDDQAARNDITVGRVNGSSVHLAQDTGPLSILLPPNGIGPVPGGGTYNVSSDSQLPDMAGWLRHLGTYDGARYPSVHVDLAAGPSLIEAAKAVQVGDRITIAHPPPECGGVGDTLDLLAQGYTETLGEFDWDITYNCTPGSPWQIAILDDLVLGRADTDGSQLAAGITATATSFQVQVTAGPLWVTTAVNPTQFPLDIRMGGEVMRVGAISGTSSPQTFSSVTRSVNGVVKSQTSGTALGLATPMVLSF